MLAYNANGNYDSIIALNCDVYTCILFMMNWLSLTFVSIFLYRGYLLHVSFVVFEYAVSNYFLSLLYLFQQPKITTYYS